MSINGFLISFILLHASLTLAKNPKEPIWPPVVQTDRGITYRSVYNDTRSVKYFSFCGIKYGRLINRFSAPAPPCYKSIKSCARGNPSISRAITPEYQIPGYPKCSQAIPENGTNYKKREKSYQYIPKVVPDDEVEDCLFLDILVPEKVWNQTRGKNKSLTAVVVYIHGGGFTSGDKSLKEDPSPLLARGLDLDPQGIIVVSINYRLGLFGFLAGAGNDFASNGGLMDQRMALGWIQKHIDKFGGDKSRVTLFGEGAGASSILHHLTAPNITDHFFPNIQPKIKHHRNFPFHFAVLQSPKFQPIITSQSDATYQKVLAVTSKIWGSKVKSVKQLRLLPYEVLYAVNTILVRESAYGTFTFGPAVDYQKGINNSYVPDYPLRRLATGRMAKGVHVMVGQKIDEGHFFEPSIMRKPDGLKISLAKMFPTVVKHHLEYVNDFLYPSRDYNSVDNGEIKRSAEGLRDIFLGCNIHYLLHTMAQSSGYVLKTTWASQCRFFEQAIFQAGARDTFGNNSSKTTINWLQDELLHFSRRGALTARIRPYDGSGRVLLASDNEPKNYIDDPSAKHQCRYWAKFKFERRK
ncbi:hypothetical protein EPUL_001685 [Erysiphe pulchra]|uniref:Carboxylesterase type B domain-containing protein n=1 Tax=Erysiphe pulchra TaxID=225359 RepID=A0A2S4PZ90_9PEZI|nr:hypothetical protein EPUL_001685 [Erysiphe pulchra]